MKRFFGILFALVWVAKTSIALIQVEDSAGRLISLTHPATRVITLAPSLTEMMVAIGAESSLVGVSTDSDYPDTIKHLPQVGGLGVVDTESILKLAPDLVIVWEGGNPLSSLQILKSFGVPVFVARFDHLTDVPILMRDFGKLTGHDESATQKAQLFEKQLKALKDKYSKRTPKRRVFIELSDLPLFTPGKMSFLNEVVSVCGGVNIFEGLPGFAEEVSQESVLTQNPDAIVGASPVDLSPWLSWSLIKAVKNHQLFVLPASLLVRNGPRILIGTEALCRALSENN